MSHVTLAPYLLTEADGSDPRITIPVKTPAALVMVESRMRGRYTVKSTNRDGVPIAIGVAKAYFQAHRQSLERLYVQMSAGQAGSKEPRRN